MRNPGLDKDYLKRSEARLMALDTLFAAESWADVVRESQEVVELTLKALLRHSGVEPTRSHDVSDVLVAKRAQLPSSVGNDLVELAAFSRRLRRDRELAFHGAEDLAPSDFYSATDAEAARTAARWTVAVVRPVMAND